MVQLKSVGEDGARTCGFPHGRGAAPTPTPRPTEPRVSAVSRDNIAAITDCRHTTSRIELTTRYAVLYHFLIRLISRVVSGGGRG